MHISMLLFLSNLFSGDMIIILLAVLILFGGEKLPEIARGLGKGLRDFKEASDGIKREINDHINSLDEKKADEALNKRAQEVIDSQTASEDHLIESHQPVEGTMTYNENHATGNDESAEGEAGKITSEHAINDNDAVRHNESGPSVHEHVENSKEI
jgi:sec-independent protein translocase protein TatA